MGRGSLMRQIAEEVLPPEERARIIKRVDIIGDIAIIKLPPRLERYGREIAEALLRRLPYVKVVLRQSEPTKGPYRVKGYEWLAGERRTWTLVKEYGCRFKVDVAKVFYTPRLSFEHMRIARMVRPGEVVVNMFAGVGPFSIIIAKHSRAKVVYSIDINPHAYELMRENIRMNRVEDRVVPLCGDAAEVILRRLVGVADRVLMPLPSLALKYLPFALLALKPGGGIVHVYLDIFEPRGLKATEIGERAVERALEALGAERRIEGSRRVRPVGPRVEQVVVDAWARIRQDSIGRLLQATRGDDERPDNGRRGTGGGSTLP